MKKTILFAALGLLGLAACNVLEPSNEFTGEGELVISVKSDDGGLTKADTAPFGKDADIRDVQLFLFLPDGTLYLRKTMDGDNLSLSLDRVRTGTYSIVAVANAPEMNAIVNKSELERTAVSLELNDPDRGFLMYGETSQTVGTSTGSAAARAEITVRRLVGRVRLTSVTNHLPASYGSLTVEYAFLENGMRSWNLSAQGTPSGYVNFAGRKSPGSASGTPADYIASAGDAECPKLTFHAVNQTVAWNATRSFDLPFYCFPNSLTEADDHFDGATSRDACVRLVLRGSYGESHQWYYPVTIPNLERNKSYDVSFIISGPGSEDPNQKVTMGGLSVVVRVDPWQAGREIEGEF